MIIDPPSVHVEQGMMRFRFLIEHASLEGVYRILNSPLDLVWGYNKAFRAQKTHTGRSGTFFLRFLGFGLFGIRSSHPS